MRVANNAKIFTSVARVYDATPSASCCAPFISSIYIPATDADFHLSYVITSTTSLNIVTELTNI